MNKSEARRLAETVSTETEISESTQTTIGSRAEHLEWCKRRALEYCDSGDPTQAFTSMCSDLRKHPETERHSAMELGVMLLMTGHLSTVDKMRHFIDGFN